MRNVLTGLAFAGAFSLAAITAQSELINAEDSSNDWTFSVEESYVGCHAGTTVRVITTESDRKHSSGAVKGKANTLGLYNLGA